MTSKERFYDRFEKVWHDLIGSPAQHTLRYTNCSGLFKEADEEIERLNGRVEELEDLLLKLASQRPAPETPPQSSKEQNLGTDERCLDLAKHFLRGGAATLGEPQDCVTNRTSLGRAIQQAVEDWFSEQSPDETPAEPKECAMCKDSCEHCMGTGECSHCEGTGKHAEKPNPKPFGREWTQDEIDNDMFRAERAEKATGLCSAHRDGEDPNCLTCFPENGKGKP